jgi:hypothetical protein
MGMKGVGARALSISRSQRLDLRASRIAATRIAAS